MSEYTVRTDTICTVKNVIVRSKQKRYWLEFQLLDEQGDPLPHQPYRAMNEATRCDVMPEFSGQSDAQGVIRLEGLHKLPVTLLLAADPLAEVLQTRRLRAVRGERRRERVYAYTYEGAPPDSPVEKTAQAEGHAYHYLRIGQLCDRLPNIQPKWTDASPPAFHFPDPTFSGFTVGADGLDRRHVLEICPFRAWNLVLHHQPEYSMANAHNLGMMADLSYTEVTYKERNWKLQRSPNTLSGSVEEFFFRQCQDLSRTPSFPPPTRRGQWLPALVVDVPFSERYTTAVMLDTRTAKVPRGEPDIPLHIIKNTQLFYASNKTQLLVAWRGTLEFQDWLTDLQYQPVAADGSRCETKAPCTHLTEKGKVHFGFLQGFEVAKKLFGERLEEIQDQSRDRKLFVCGHSLGGALGLIHSAELKDREPLLYTYGMPRTFTAMAMQHLRFRHYRHINDADPIPCVPPEAELDNWLYDALGPLGPDLGYLWSLAQLPVSKIVEFGDPYWHHGESVLFFKTEQTVQIADTRLSGAGSKDGLGAPRHRVLTMQLPKSAKLYLVPSLSDEKSRLANEQQKAFIQSLSRDSLKKYFPPYSNPETGSHRIDPVNHFMSSQYLPFLHNQLLELCDPARPMLRKEERAAFEEQLKTHSQNSPEEERVRNQLFLDLQALLPMALSMTERLEGGAEAIERFRRLEREFGEPIELTHSKRPTEE
ncbi:lipase family protein [Pseudomonas citronellolis]|uniref:lipase family protein n=1 Tax=Pseudomonas citronellolis TaxID=53408 RepID=UPI0023E45140|nr:lipase family protein [Pseudomonas citronellolis]MDF3935945.1 lipase family protein [Pseudomonas citronellolis]